MVRRLAILIIGYKNLIGIQRLISSLLNADYCQQVDLIVSIDHSDSDLVEKYATTISWPNGNFYVKTYEENLGLRAHILKCGDYIDEFELDAMAVFEDDIYVAPSFFNYMVQAVNFYFDDKNVAGISLYKHEKNILAKKIFIPAKQGKDTFFMQYAQSWGQIWLKNQWHDFRKWLDEEKYKYMESKPVPRNILRWEKSWLKFHIMYCIDMNKYFVYPYHSLTTNFTDAGVHNYQNNTDYQVPLEEGKQVEYNFAILDDASVKYDAFFENNNIAKYLQLNENMITIDLYGSKTFHDDKNFWLTTQKCNYKILNSWGLRLRPHEMNIFRNIEGNDIFLYDTRYIGANGNPNNKSFKLAYYLKGVNVFDANVISYILKETVSMAFIRIKRILKR